MLVAAILKPTVVVLGVLSKLRSAGFKLICDSCRIALQFPRKLALTLQNQGEVLADYLIIMLSI